MKHRANEYVPGMLNVVSGISVLLISFLVECRIPMSKAAAKPIGLLVLYCGMFLVGWATVFIKGAILGEVTPVLPVLVQDGPYAFVRHPVYLGMTIALFGATIALRSWVGMLGTLVLFLPSEMYRAKLEDKALAAKFGEEWENYALRVSSMLPSIKR